MEDHLPLKEITVVAVEAFHGFFTEHGGRGIKKT